MCQRQRAGCDEVEEVCTLLPSARSPHFGVAHAMCLGLAPWLAAEVPHLVETGAIAAKA